jgi:hypothetical protein
MSAKPPYTIDVDGEYVPAIEVEGIYAPEVACDGSYVPERSHTHDSTTTHEQEPDPCLARPTPITW